MAKSKSNLKIITPPDASLNTPSYWEIYKTGTEVGSITRAKSSNTVSVSFLEDVKLSPEDLVIILEFMRQVEKK